VGELARAFGDRVAVDPPSGGMALWAKVDLRPPEVLAWERRAAEHGVVFIAGERLTFDRRGLPYVRLGFAPLDERELREAVRRLARAFPR
jgi:GntR family transcriptional regulator/MocR family aminotransferase